MFDALHDLEAINRFAGRNLSGDIGGDELTNFFRVVIIPHDTFSSLVRAKEEEIPVVMTLQTLWGYTGMDVYETGRELQSYGVIPGKNMLPETAIAKLSWILGNYDDPKEIRQLITTDIAGEITLGEPINGFQVMQGVEHLIK